MRDEGARVALHRYTQGMEERLAEHGVAIEGRIHGVHRVTRADDGTRRARRSVEVIVDRIAYLSLRPTSEVAGGRP